MSGKRKFFTIVGVLAVVGAAIAGVLYVAFPVPMITYGGMGLNFLKTLSTPAGEVRMASAFKLEKCPPHTTCPR